MCLTNTNMSLSFQMWQFAIFFLLESNIIHILLDCVPNILYIGNENAVIGFSKYHNMGDSV